MVRFALRNRTDRLKELGGPENAEVPACEGSVTVVDKKQPFLTVCQFLNEEVCV